MTGTWPTGFSDGDIIAASEYKKQAGSIYDTTLGVAAASITASGIVATYAHLLITLYARSDQATTIVGSLMRFNGDAAANYDYQFVQGQAATAAAAETFGATSVQIGNIPANSAGANLFGANQIFIPHYAGSSNNKQVVAIGSSKLGTATTNLNAVIFGGGWRSTAAINSITIFAGGSGNLMAGTRMTIHALGA